VQQRQAIGLYDRDVDRQSTAEKATPASTLTELVWAFSFAKI